MNLQTILSILGAAEQLTSGLANLVNNAGDVFKETDAAQVKAAAAKLKAANDQLDQVVLAKLG